jgi:hypothetical protein
MTTTHLTDGVTIDHGIVDVNTVNLVVDHDDVKVWVIDCDTKYAEIGFTSFHNKSVSIHLGANANTIGLSIEHKGSTAVIFDYPTKNDEDHWRFSASGSRYEFVVTAFLDRT